MGIRRRCMKKRIRKAASTMLALCLLICLGISAYADAGVTYSDTTTSFSFKVEGTEDVSDLFGNLFKDMMPGDTNSQLVTITNASQKLSAKVYFKVEPANQEARALLKATSFRVTSNGAVLYESKEGAEFQSVGNWIEIAKLAPQNSTSLTATLSAPLSLGNEYQGTKAEMIWYFLVQEGYSSSDNNTTTNTTSTTTGVNGKSVKTGDESHIIAYTVAALVAIAAIPVVVIFGKKKAKKDPEKTDT